MIRNHLSVAILLFGLSATLSASAVAQECNGVAGGSCTTLEDDDTIGDLSGECIDIGPVNGGTNGGIGTVVECQYKVCYGEGSDPAAGDPCNVVGTAGTCRVLCDLDANKCDPEFGLPEFICVVGEEGVNPVKDDDGGGCSTTARGASGGGILFGLFGLLLWRRRAA